MTARLTPLMRRILSWTILVALIAGGTAALLAVSIARTPVERTVQLVVVPHPDDEFQTWSLVEDDPSTFKVFVSLTRGDETGYCERDILETSLQADLGELPPSPEPTGKWTTECVEARQNSLLGYLQQMSRTDPTIPGDFGQMTAFAGLSADGIDICREDDGELRCDESVRTARVWLDAQDRGAVVFFDLGDGDLLQEEAAWALQTLLASREQWGLDAASRVGAVVGAFANEGHSCYSYPHPDHVAVHQMLWNVDLGAGPQVGATCFLDPSQRMSAFVSREAADAAFARAPDDTRLGAHGIHYGWLNAGAFPLAGVRQDNLFMRFQSFWVRFN